MLAVVIAIESARSALKSEHHRLEYWPPGDEVTTSSVMPVTGGRSNILTVAYLSSFARGRNADERARARARGAARRARRV